MGGVAAAHDDHKSTEATDRHTVVDNTAATCNAMQPGDMAHCHASLWPVARSRPFPGRASEAASRKPR